MASCKACGAPLDGPMAFIAGLMGVKPSGIARGYCNKCEDMALAKKRAGTLKSKKRRTTGKKSTKRRTKKTSTRKSTKRKSKRRKKR